MRTHWSDAGGHYPANIEGVEDSVEATLCFGHAGEHLDLRGGRKGHDIEPALDESVDEGPRCVGAASAHPVDRQVVDLRRRRLQLCKHWAGGFSVQLHND